MSEKDRSRYDLRVGGLAWLIVIGAAVGYELWALGSRTLGAPLTHVFYWAYGDVGSLRWWVLGCAFWGFFLWLPWHFMFRFPGLPHLLCLAGIGAALGAVGWLLTK